MSEAAVQAPTPKKRSAKSFIIVGAVALLVAAAAAAWWTLRPAAPAAGDASPSAPVARTPSVYLPLEQFTVNLSDEGGERFAQIAVTLELIDSQTESTLKSRMPTIRNAILLLLSSSTSRELLTVAGKQKLAEQIATIAGGEAGWRAGAARANPVLGAHFSHFIVQ